MSGRGRPRKVRDENPGASTAKGPRGTQKKGEPSNEEQVEETITTDAKTSCHSKPQGGQEACASATLENDNPLPAQQTPKPTKSDGRKAASRSSETQDIITEKTSATLQGASAFDDDVTCASKVQESQAARARKPPSDAESTEKTQAPPAATPSENNCSARRGSGIDGNPSKVLQNALEN